ncbi:Arginyl-tRNA synthetase [Escherichia coli]|uniref:Arginyl-tRNA synthetase n=1 Tax=Escherichia coli TaxID=562 RepID=A0A2X3M071_ECOLX|nr:Arginyl-tRNA synthetase [Escherichia coli]
MIMVIIFNVVRFLPPSHRTGDYEGTTPRSVNAVNPGVYRFLIIPRTLAQRSLPVGLRSLLMREYSDDTAHQQNLFQALSTDIFLRPFQLLVHRHQPLSEG